MITRIVMVDFNQDAPEEAFRTYKETQQKLAKLPVCEAHASGIELPPSSGGESQRGYAARDLSPNRVRRGISRMKPAWTSF